MSRRLIETRGGRALYEYDGSDGFGRRAVWEPIVTPKTNLTDIAPLASSVRPVSLDGGLYAQGKSRAERQSRAIDARLKALGLKTPRRRVR